MAEIAVYVTSGGRRLSLVTNMKGGLTVEGLDWNMVSQFGFAAVMSVGLLLIVDKRLTKIGEDLREVIVMLKSISGDLRVTAERLEE